MVVQIEIRNQIAQLPKAELHVHLEGAVRPSTVLRLAKQNGIDVPFSNAAQFAEYCTFPNFQRFIQTYGVINSALVQPDDFMLVAEEFGVDAARDGTRYAEVTFTAGTHYRSKGIPFDELLEAVTQGALNANRKTGIEIRFIIDHDRAFGIDECMQTAEWCLAGRNRGVVAMGLGGPENGRPASAYAEVLAWLVNKSIPFVPHAGETEGPAGIWDALRFNPVRLGHGFRAVEDTRLLVELRRRGTVLELCPTSNVRTGVVSNLRAHPLRQLWNAGIPITLNTDDPAIFRTTLTDEYLLAGNSSGLNIAHLANISLTALDAALADGTTKARLRTEFIQQFKVLGITPEAHPLAQANLETGKSISRSDSR